MSWQLLASNGYALKPCRFLSVRPANVGERLAIRPLGEQHRRPFAAARPTPARQTQCFVSDSV